MIKLVNFEKSHYASLISWIGSEEALMQFGGPNFSFPLTAKQLDESAKDPNRIAFAVLDTATHDHIGHGEIYLLEDAAKLGRIIIGDQRQRGKGVGEMLVNELVQYAIQHTGRTKIELNVFDWNKAAIRCYEKVGFVINPDKTLERKIKGETWTALNMVYLTPQPPEGEGARLL